MKPRGCFEWFRGTVLKIREPPSRDRDSVKVRSIREPCRVHVISSQTDEDGDVTYRNAGRCTWSSSAAATTRTCAISSRRPRGTSGQTHPRCALSCAGLLDAERGRLRLVLFGLDCCSSALSRFGVLSFFSLDWVPITYSSFYDIPSNNHTRTVSIKPYILRHAMITTPYGPPTVVVQFTGRRLPGFGSHNVESRIPTRMRHCQCQAPTCANV